MRNNIEKKLAPKGDGSEKRKLLKLASEDGASEFQLELGTLYDEYKDSDFDGSFDEYLKSKNDDVRVIKLSEGGDVESVAELYDAYEKGIDVLPGESVSQYIKRIKMQEALND